MADVPVRKISTLPVTTAAGTTLPGINAGTAVRVPVGGPNGLAMNSADGVPLATKISALESGQSAGQIVVKTWAILSTMTGAEGVGAQVIDDAGTHTDPVTSATVDNQGQYAWNVAEEAWEWVRADGLALKADKAVVDGIDRAIADDMDVNVFDVASSVNLYNPENRIDGRYVNSAGAIAGNPSAACSGFIPVTPGASYTISANGLKVGSTAFYSTNDITGAGYIDGSVSTAAVTVGSPLTVTAPAGSLYLVTSLATATIPETSEVQVESGTTATEYIPYGGTKRTVKAEKIPGIPEALETLDEVAADSAAIRGALSVVTLAAGRPTDAAIPDGNKGLGVDMVFEGPVTVDSFVEAVRFYAAIATTTYLQIYTLAGGVFTRTASYALTATEVGDHLLTREDIGTIHIPAGSYVGFRGGSGLRFNSPSAADGAGWYIGTAGNQASFAKGAIRTTSRMHAGVELRAIGDFSEALSDIEALKASVTPGALSVAVGAAAITVTDAVNDKPLVHVWGKTASKNGGLRLTSTTYDSVSIATVGDDITPIRLANLGTVGANHGYVVGVFLAPNPDGKTSVDLGSTWQDSAGREYVLAAITNHATTPLMFMGAYTGGSGGVPVAASGSLPVTPLTHKANATHTGPIPVGGIVNAGASASNTQLLPATARNTQALIVDGASVSADGTFSGNEVVIEETYEILDYKSIYDVAKANVGVSYASLRDASIAGTVLVRNQYRHRSGGRMSVTTSYDELYPTPLSTCGSIQANPLSLAGYTTTRYVPGMGSAGGFDWGAGVDLTSYASSVNLPASAELVAGQISSFSLDVLESSGTPYLGFAMGYLPFGARPDGAGRSARRATNADTALWNMRETKKCYPAFTTGEAAGWGHLQVDAFRVFLSPAQVGAVLARKTSSLGAWAVLSAAALVE